VHRRDGGAQPGLLAACRCQAGAPADGGAQAVGGGGPGLAAAVRQLTTVSDSVAAGGVAISARFA
jgi:hypothetical protein